MALSRNIYAKSILSNDLKRRFRSVNQPKRISDKQTLIENLSKGRYVTPSRNSDQEKQDILNNFDTKKIDELRKNKTDELEKQEILNNFDNRKNDELKIKTVELEKQEILNNSTENNRVSQPENDEFERQDILNNFDTKKIDELRKRQKFAPYDENLIIGGGDNPDPNPPLSSLCGLFDTDFELDCDYLQYTGILGLFTILQNFESFGEGDTEDDIYLYEPIYNVDDFESYDEGVYDFSNGSPNLTQISNFNATKDFDAGTITLSWNDVDYEDFYILEKSTDDITYSPLQTLLAGATGYVDNDNLVDGTVYYYQIKATNSNGESNWSYVDIQFDDTQYALSFDGINDKVITNQPIDFGTNIWTIESYYEPLNGSAYGHIFTHNNVQINLACKITTLGEGLRPYFYNNNVNTYSTPNAISLTIGQKSHLAYVYDGSSLKIYVDGVLSTSTPTGGFNIPIGQFTIQGGNNEYTNAIHDELRVWIGEARTQQQIQDNMGLELTGNEPNLHLYYKMNEGSGTTLTDNAGTNDGTINGATWVQL